MHGHHHISSKTNGRMFDQLREIGLGRYTVLCSPCRSPTARTPQIHRLDLSTPYQTSSIPSSTNRSEAPSRFAHVSSVNLGDFSINCSIHAYRRLIDPRQRSSLGAQRQSHDCVRRLYFYRQYEETTTCQPNVHNTMASVLRPSKT